MLDPPIISQMPHVIGLVLDGAEEVMIDAAENDALCASMGVLPDPDGQAHPSYYYIATQIGMGLTVAELCAACEFDVDDGPMMAASTALFHKPIMTNQPYRVRGEVVGLIRKKSRKLGIMDLLQYRLMLIGPDGDQVLEARNTWVLPRGGTDQ